MKPHNQQFPYIISIDPNILMHRHHIISPVILLLIFSSCENEMNNNLLEQEPSQQVMVNQSANTNNKQEKTEDNITDAVGPPSAKRQAILINETEFNHATGLGSLAILPLEILQSIIQYLISKDMQQIRSVNKIFYQLTTGYETPGLCGVAHKPQPTTFINTAEIIAHDRF